MRRTPIPPRGPRRTRGRYSDASRLYRRALTLAEDVYGPTDRELAPILSELASAEQAQGHCRRIRLTRRSFDRTARPSAGDFTSFMRAADSRRAEAPVIPPVRWRSSR